jgi:asparagine synthase (glutamine-hydrolysing)
MSGVFGIANPSRKVDAKIVTQKMMTVMSHRSWYVTECLIDENSNIGIGRIGIGIFNPKPQPVTNETGGIALFVSGEFYNLAELGKNSEGQSDEAFLLELFEAQGKEIFKKLNGSFIIVVWDKTKGRIILVTDRLGTYPIYYYFDASRFLFSPEVKGILCDSSLNKNLDLVSLAQFMRFQQVFGDRTYFEDIKRMPPATIMEYDLHEHQLIKNRYWDYSDIPYHPKIGFDEAVEETGRLFRIAVKRLSQEPLRPGVYLSGGLDSRAILGMIDQKPLISVTYGHKDCRDVFYAGKVASAVGSEHHWFDLPDGHWVEKYVDFHLELTEGVHSWIHAHGISTLAEAKKLMDVNLSGWDGGTVMGDSDSIEPLQTSPVDDIAYRVRMFYLYNQINTWPSITELEERYLYTDEMYKKLRGVAADTMLEELNRFLKYRHEVRSEFFFASNGLPNSQAAITFLRSHLEVRFPFFDYDFFDFIYSLPTVHRQDKKLYRAMLRRELPKLALIPYDSDEFLPTSNKLLRSSHALFVKTKRKVKKYLIPSLHERFTLYADYENYLRTDLKSWAEGILFRPEVGERNIFNVDFIKSIYARHMSGYEMWTIGKIAPIMTYEMMLRRFYD